jgi:hypothetical protein
MKVSIYKNFSSEGSDVQIDYVFDKIRKGGDFVTTIDKIRDSKDENEQQALKKTLPGVTFCGRFKHRKASRLIESTGLVILDFDEKGVIPEMSEYFYALFKSPRGGYKALVKIPMVSSDNEFKQYFYAIQNHFPDVDTSGKDISRFCFISYDPDLYINENSKLWDTTVETVKSESSRIVVKSDFKKLSLAVQMIDRSDIGNRNNTFLKVGRLMGGYIASGELNEMDVLDVCDRAIFDKDQQDYRENFKTFRRGIDYGKAEPLSSGEVKEINTEIKLGKIDYTIEEADELLDGMYQTGFVKGYLTNWKHFDDYYSVRLGFTTYIYGAPFTGKSKFCFNMLVNLSVNYGLKHLIYSPETGSKEDIYAMLIQIYAEGDITNSFKNQIPKEKYDKAKNFIGRHFIVISTDETDTDLTLEELLDYADIICAKFNTKIDTITIDPWNELLHEDEFKRDLYLNVALKKARVNARKKNRHIFIITHIRDQKPLGYDELGTAIYPFPSPNDIAGGQVWNRKGFMMMALYRHFVLDGHESVTIGKDKIFGKNDLLVRVQKFKPEGTGKRGEVKFIYHPHKHTYSDEFANFAIRPTEEKIFDDDPIPF